MVASPAAPTAPTSALPQVGVPGNVVTEKLSNAAVASWPSLWLLTANPTSTGFGRLTDTTGRFVHASPSLNRQAACTLPPRRESLSHTGAVTAMRACSVLVPP